MIPLILSSIGMGLLFLVSLWMLYINQQILQVTRDIYVLTAHIDYVSTQLVSLNQKVVENTSLPSNLL